MNTKPLSASRLELAATCPGSHAHEHIETTNEAAERGSAVHDYIAAILQGKDHLLPKDEKAAALCRLLDRSELIVRATPNGHDKLLVEQALYLLPTSLSGLPGEAGLLEGDYHRDYSGAPEGALVGTADVIAVEDDGVTVTDWKTGRGEVAHPADNYQLKFLGLAAARSFGKHTATVQIGAIRTDGSVDTSSHTMEAEELQEITSELARIGRRVEAARNGEPVYTTGSHCRFCPALAHCPAISGAAVGSQATPGFLIENRSETGVVSPHPGVAAFRNRRTYSTTVDEGCRVSGLQRRRRYGHRRRACRKRGAGGF